VNVLYVLHAPNDPRTAVYAHASRRAALLNENGHQATIWTPLDFPGLSRGRPTLLPFTYPPRILTRLARARPGYDLVLFHSFTGWASLLARALLPQLSATRMVTQFHGLEPLYMDAVAREAERRGSPLTMRYRLLAGPVMSRLLASACRRSDGVLCLNSQEERFLLDKRWVVPERLDRLPQEAPNELLMLRREPVPERLMFLGQWLPAKGIGDLLQVFGTLAISRPALRLHCVGTRVPAERVLADFPPDLRARVEVLGEASRSDVASAFRSAGLFVFPSLSEGSSMALIEAMASGLPIVSTAVGAAPDLLRHGESALLVPPAAPAALQQAIEQVLDHPDFASGLGERARAVARNLSWRHVAPDYLRRIDRLGGARL
jgi:glycosyltransferase involved in cell wall biosynthesis